MSLLGTNNLILALGMGFAFGFLLHRGKVTNCNALVSQLRLRDFTVLKVMLTAIVVGGIGVQSLVHFHHAVYYIKDANLLGVALGAGLFGVGLVFYGYCPGTALAAAATGSLSALVGALGMVTGAIFFALTFDWTKSHILNVCALGKVRLPEITGVPDIVWLAALALGAFAFFHWIEHRIPAAGKA